MEIHKVRQLTPEGQAALDDMATRHGVSADTVRTLLDALAQGNGGSAQFNISELGGRGQWMRGGMTQVGNMFDHALKAKVDSLCSELSALLNSASASSEVISRAAQTQFQQQSGGREENYGRMTSFFGSDESSSEWWPSGLGHPSTAGAQNSMRYAVFPEARRLALDVNGKIIVYDTQDFRISGVSQQQSDRYSLVFTSQRGMIRAEDLPVASRGAETDAVPDPSPEGSSPRPARADAAQIASSAPRSPSPPDPPATPKPPVGDDVLTLIERLGQLKDKGLLSDDEFAAKKTELLSRL